jgi:hypothetical protein
MLENVIQSGLLAIPFHVYEMGYLRRLDSKALFVLLRDISFCLQVGTQSHIGGIELPFLVCLFPRIFGT